MSLAHKLKKISIYFVPGKPYWRSVKHGDWKVQSAIGPFMGMHIKDRLYDNHYDKFDEEGLPIRMAEGKRVYNYTTICSYALANYELYLETGDRKYTEPLFKTLDFLKRKHETTPYNGIVFPGKQDSLSAMNQGEALAVIARCYELDPREELVELARKITLAYQYKVEEQGVLGQFAALKNTRWYEEKAVIPGKHILNGMCYATVGLRDISIAMPQLKEAEELWRAGLQYIKQALPLYDTGSWTYYWVADRDPHYIASMMYHNLHICQLNYLAKVTDDEEFARWAGKFEKYSGSSLKRMSAGLQIIKEKWQKR